MHITQLPLALPWTLPSGPWRIQGYRVECRDHLARHPLCFAIWHETCENAEATLAVHQRVHPWKQSLLVPVLTQGEKDT